MRISFSQTTTRLGTDLTFEVVDMRGKRGFPQGQKGLLFAHHERREIRCVNTGLPIKRDATYVIRADETGWRIDEVFAVGPATAVYGPDREDHFPTQVGAAKALKAYLDVLATTSSLGG